MEPSSPDKQFKGGDVVPREIRIERKSPDVLERPVFASIYQVRDGRRCRPEAKAETWHLSKRRNFRVYTGSPRAEATVT